MIETFEIAGYREVKHEDVESGSQAPMEKDEDKKDDK